MIIADDQSSSIAKESIYYIKHMYIQPFSMEVDWQEKHSMDVSTMFYICRYCVFTLLGSVKKTPSSLTGPAAQWKAAHERLIGLDIIIVELKTKFHGLRFVKIDFKIMHLRPLILRPAILLSKILNWVSWCRLVIQ